MVRISFGLSQSSMKSEPRQFSLNLGVEKLLFRMSGKFIMQCDH